MTGEIALRPLLTKYPDARRGAAPLLEPILLPYVGLMFGSLAAGLLGAYNAAVLKRPGLALRSLLVGVAGWIAFVFVVVLVRNAVDNVNVGVVFGRLLHFALGGLLFAIQRPHVRGHTFLGGTMAPLLGTYLAAIFLSILMPSNVTRLLLGAWLGGR